MKEIRLKEEDFGAESEWTRKCPHCGRTLLSPLKGWNAQQELQKMGDHRLDGLQRECDCPGEVAERKADEERTRQEEQQKKDAIDKRLFEESGMPESWRNRRLSMWQEETEQRRDALRKVTAYGHKIEAGDYPGVLYISGNIGTGKTFLASCLARELHREGVSVRWTKAGDISRELNDAHKDYKQRERETS